MRIKLGISPCPNDTFMFYHLINSKRFNLDLTVADVEELNHKVLHHELDISKVSFYAAMQVMDHYKLLDAGAALGENCGPLLVARENHATKMKDATIGIPGCYTTANLLFSLYAENEGQKVFMPFSRIMPALKDGLLDFGVIIHEGRFTYKHHGLVEVADLGKWWQDVTQMPIPLGGIVSKKELPAGLVKTFTEALHDSISKALGEKGDLSAPIHSYVREHAQEMEMDVIHRHIDLYVNDYSLSLGEKGRKALDKLFHMARENGL